MVLISSKSALKIGPKIGFKVGKNREKTANSLTEKQYLGPWTLNPGSTTLGLGACFRRLAALISCERGRLEGCLGAKRAP